MTSTQTMLLADAERAWPHRGVRAGQFVVVTTWTSRHGERQSQLTGIGRTPEEALARTARDLERGTGDDAGGTDEVYLIVSGPSPLAPLLDALVDGRRGRTPAPPAHTPRTD